MPKYFEMYTSNMLKNIYSLITDWLLITWYIIDVSQGINIIEHVIMMAIFNKSHASAADKRVFLHLPLKQLHQICNI